jgi:hypothetical protein
MMTIRRSQNIAALLLLHLLSGSGGDQPDDGEAGDGVGGGAAGRLLVTAGCGNGGAAGLAERFSILSLKEHKNMYDSVLRIRDVYPGSRILIFIHPGSRIPDPKTAIKERG